MKFDEAKHKLRAKDEELSVSWKAGVPSLAISVSKFQGQMTSVEFGTAYAFTEELTPNQVYKYRFSTIELKKPIQGAIAACAWHYRSIPFGKL